MTIPEQSSTKFLYPLMPISCIASLKKHETYTTLISTYPFDSSERKANSKTPKKISVPKESKTVEHPPKATPQANTATWIPH